MDPEKLARADKREKKELLALNPKNARQLMKIIGVLIEAECPDDWLEFGLEKFKGAGLTVREAIAQRALYCLTSNAKYANTDLFKELMSRLDGKVKLTVEHRRRDLGDDDEDLDGLTPAELQVEIEKFIRNHAKPKQLEGETS